MKKNKKMYLLIGMVITMAGCKGTSSGAPASDPSQILKNMVNANGTDITATANYSARCASSTIPNIGDLKFPGVKTEFDLSSLTFTKKQFYFNDAGCTSQAIIIQESGKLDILGKSTQVPGATDTNFNFEHTTVTIQDPAIITVFNLLTVCGINDWTANKTRDVSSQATEVTCPGKASPRVAQEVATMNNGNLFLGSDASEKSGASRPTKIDDSVPYILIPGN